MHKTSPNAPTPLFRDSPVPRYAQLADVFRQRIARNRWPPGTKLPTLEALMSEFDVARVTVRQAMELLARDGLVSPERGRGTFVMAQPEITSKRHIGYSSFRMPFSTTELCK